MSNNENNKSETYIKVAKVIAEQLPVDENKISLDVTFDSLGADSLEQIEILMKVEEIFNIEISDEEADKVTFVKDLVTCIDRVISKNSIL